MYQGAASASLLASSRSVACGLWSTTASCFASSATWRSIVLRRSSFRSCHDCECVADVSRYGCRKTTLMDCNFFSTHVTTTELIPPDVSGDLAADVSESIVKDSPHVYCATCCSALACASSYNQRNQICSSFSELCNQGNVFCFMWPDIEH